MDAGKYLDLKRELIEAGYAGEIDWCEDVRECESADAFALEHAFVVCNSGMRAQVAVQIYRRVAAALKQGASLNGVFGNRSKRRAIQHVWDNRERLFAEYLAAEDKLAFLETLPHIGKIVKYHLAKNFGMDVAKPDRHLVRIAAEHGTTYDVMCRSLSEAVGDRVGTVDYVIWRAANLGMI